MAGQVRYYIDQSLMGVWHEWGRARDDITVVGELEGTVPGDKDEEWIPVVAAAGLIVIGRDKRIRTRPAEVALLRSHALRYIWLGGKQDAPTATYVERLEVHWPSIEQLRLHRPDGPWWFSLTASGLKERSIPEVDRQR
ncbi:MAG: hypothetical protein IT195_07805 [Microthrixaceae bacterium]|nr:hypothetical protein [Microthrixaceae bacterium]